jgi:hypothetical protein
MRKKRRAKTIEERAEEILREDPVVRRERTMRLLAERIAYHEARIEQRRVRSAR